MGNLLSGRNILVMGVRNKWSIAWGIAKAAYDEGANLIFTYQGEREKESVEGLADQLGGIPVYQCDVSSDIEIEDTFDKIQKSHGMLHGVVHGIAHAKSEDIHNSFINTSRDGFSHALNISAYSLVAVSRCASNIMSDGGSILTLTYMGSEKVFPGYNVMGVAKAALEACVRYLAHDLGQKRIRINAISAGPVKTVSSKAIKDFNSILDVFEQKSPLKLSLGPDELGGTGVYLLSDLSKAVTGEVIHVDCGYNIMGI